MQYEITGNVAIFRGLGKPNASVFLDEQRDKEFGTSRVYQQDKGRDDDGLDNRFRNSHQRSIHHEHPYILAAARAIKQVNEEYFKINVTDYCRENSLVRYGEGGFFKPHSDILWPATTKDHTATPIRKLTSIMLISDTSDFTGGKLRMWNDNVMFRTDFEQGDLLVFPSYTRHVVDEVTSGLRYSLVMWSNGYF